MSPAGRSVGPRLGSRGGRTGRAGLAAALAIVAAFAVAGCQYLFGLTPLPGGPLESFDPGDFGSFGPGNPFPAAVVLKTGSATVEIDGTTTNLDLSSGSDTGSFGTEATWSDGKGLYVRYFSSGSTLGAEDSFISIDQVRDGTHLTTMDPTACKLTVAKRDNTGLAGSATCKGLRWIDTMAGFEPVASPPVEGNPFDAVITFEAAP